MKNEKRGLNVPDKLPLLGKLCPDSPPLCLPARLLHHRQQLGDLGDPALVVDCARLAHLPGQLAVVHDL